MPVAGIAVERVEVPDGVTVTVEEAVVRVRSGDHDLSRRLWHPRIQLAVEGNEVTIRCDLPHRQERAIVGTFASHVRNMVLGVTKGWQYRMRIVYSHFPMKATVREGEVLIENFLGERHPRRAKIMGTTTVEIDGDQVLVQGPDIEAVGQTAANIEQATKIRGFDPRVFQDGIYIVTKAEEAT